MTRPRFLTHWRPRTRGFSPSSFARSALSLTLGIALAAAPGCGDPASTPPPAGPGGADGPEPIVEQPAGTEGLGTLDIQ